MRRYGWLIAVVALIALWAWSQRAPVPTHAPATTHEEARTPTQSLPGATETSRAPSASTASPPAWLPEEAIETLRLIRDGGPFPHRQDGSTFQNREGRLPRQPRGYYREYTVDTPGSDDRGARRIVAGGGIPGQSPPSEFFYTDDHYRSFRRFTQDVAESEAARR